MQDFKLDKFGGIHGWIEAEEESLIHVQIRGQGPPILVMGGVGSGAFSKEEIASHLAEKHTVISYDRRCTFRSTGNPENQFNFSQQCRDIVRILEACELRSALIFATCASASIALELLISHPKLVDVMLVHEPMCPWVLPDAESQLNKLNGYLQIAQDSGVVEGLGAFLKDFDLPFPLQFQKRFKINGPYMLNRELLACVVQYQPNIKALQIHKNRIIMAAGKQCLERGLSSARTALVMSKQIDCQFAVLPGNHTGYFQEPAAFANAVFSLIESPLPTNSSFGILHNSSNLTSQINPALNGTSMKTLDQSIAGTTVMLKNVKKDTLENLKDRIKSFTQARDWEKFHNPKNLSMAMISECAELVEHFQWLTLDQSMKLPEEKYQEVALEMADILIYLILCAERLKIDLIDAANRKIEINETRFPVEEVFGGNAQIASGYGSLEEFVDRK
jgi:NTP pyrophosphatase (non-canonical NTP hydrolase)/pimeloyl-ACP methyl ester carboxylesterase